MEHDKPDLSVEAIADELRLLSLAVIISLRREDVAQYPALWYLANRAVGSNITKDHIYALETLVRAGIDRLTTRFGTISAREAALRLFNLDGGDDFVDVKQRSIDYLRGGKGDSQKMYDYIRGQLLDHVGLDSKPGTSAITNVRRLIAENLISKYLDPDVARSNANKGAASAEAAELAEMVTDECEPLSAHVATPIAASQENLSLGPLDETLVKAAMRLAEVVRDQVRLRLQQVAGTVSLPLRWTGNDLFGNLDTAIDLAGDLDHIADMFDRIPSGRLVVLGRPGSGKSVLALRFVLARLLSAHRQPSLQVPVVLPLSSWPPSHQSLRDWIADVLISEYPFLRPKYLTAPTVAHALLQRSLILPVLDGFDEVAPELQRQALMAIDREFPAGDHFLLTSQHDAYAAAVDTANTALPATAVVELSDPDFGDICDYLRRTTRKVPRDGMTATKWDPVLDRWRDEPTDPAVTRLRTALSTPLMVALARAAYSETDGDPTTLLDTTRFAEPGSIEDHLLDGFISVAYERSLSRDPADSGKVGRRWTEIEARDYLGFLAVHLHYTGDPDLRWWKFGWPGGVVGLVGPIAFVYFIGSYEVVGLLLGGAKLTQPPNGPFLIGATCCMAAALITMGFRLLTRATVARGLMRRRRQAIQVGLLGLLVATGILYMLALSVLLPKIGLGPLITAGIGIGLLVSMLLSTDSNVSIGHLFFEPRALIKYPARDEQFDNPLALLPVARRIAIRHSLIATPIYALGVLVVAWRSGLTHNWPWIVAACLAAFAAAFLANNMYGDWVITRTNLAVRGWLPWNALEFLQDAHSRGVLRQIGASYRFRHSLLQDRLAVQLLDTGFRYTGPQDVRATLYTNLGSALINTGRLNLAERQLAALHALGEPMYGPDSNWSLKLQLQLATASDRTMSDVEAEMTIRRIVDTLRQQVLLHESPGSRRESPFYAFDINSTRQLMVEAWYELAHCLETAGQVAKSESEYRQLVDVQIQDDDALPIQMARERLQIVRRRLAAGEQPG